MNLGDKKTVLQDKVTRRRDKTGKGDIPAWFAVFVFLFGIVMFTSGYMLDYKTSVSKMDNSKTFQVDGYNITFLPDTHPKMSGDVVGFDVVQGNKRFFIQNGLTKNQVRTTCVHEKLHDLGIGGGDSRGHDWIRMHEGSIEDYTCEKLIDKMQKQGLFS